MKELDNLEPGAEYYVRLTGIIKGKGNKKTPSVETSFFTDIDTIREFDAVEIDSEELKLTWRRPFAEVTHYTLYVASIGENDNHGKYNKIDAVASPGGTETYKLGNLKPASRYTLELTPFFETRSCLIENDRPRCSSGTKYFNTKLEKPAKLDIEILTPNYVVITWPYVPAATHYTVTVAKQNGTHPRSADVYPSHEYTGICKRFAKSTTTGPDRLCYEGRIDESIKYTFRVQGTVRNISLVFLITIPTTLKLCEVS